MPQFANIIILVSRKNVKRLYFMWNFGVSFHKLNFLKNNSTNIHWAKYIKTSKAQSLYWGHSQHKKDGRGGTYVILLHAAGGCPEGLNANERQHPFCLALSIEGFLHEVTFSFLI